ncbi:MAG TPA: hypothetical protein VHT70_02105 [Candidatus Saccharimonadales bacterium]|jgi:hypothetical protein|nr:hypothetical protein [Candidatus Saccharimonadales bacterium]
MREAAPDHSEEPNLQEAQKALQRSVMSLCHTIGQIGEPVVANSEDDHFNNMEHIAAEHGVTLPPDAQIGRYARVRSEQDDHLTMTYVGTTFGEITEFAGDNHAPIANVMWVADVYPDADDAKHPSVTVWGSCGIYAKDWDDKAGHQAIGADMAFTVEPKAGQHEQPAAMADLWRDMHLDDVYPCPEQELVRIEGLHAEAHHVDAITRGMRQGVVRPEETSPHKGDGSQDQT